jgi:YD repeat-containing protein
VLSATYQVYCDLQDHLIGMDDPDLRTAALHT